MNRPFLEVVRERIAQHHDQELYLFTNEAVLNTLDQRLDTPHRGYTFGEMDQKFKAVAANLQRVAQRGDRVLILHEPGEHFVNAFMGCLYAGMTAVPIYPPNPARLDRTLPYFLAVIQDAQPSVVLTNGLFESAAQEFLGHLEGINDVAILRSTRFDLADANQYKPCTPAADEVALFQYTSGSTGSPKGVMLTHGNLQRNLADISNTHNFKPRDRQVSWLPPYHDLGLIAGILTPLYIGGQCLLMSPMEFLQDPNRWLQAIHYYRAQGTGGPNFGYDIMAKKFKPETFRHLDLSCCKVAINGAEPIKWDSIQRFADLFEPYGFDINSFCFSYGMSEATNMVSGGLAGSSEVRYVQRGALEKNRQIIELPKPTSETRAVVSCGKILASLDLRVVDPITLQECAQDRAGEIWLKGDSIGKGYWNDKAKTAATFNATLPETNESGFLRTGDYGFVRNGELYITGRLKDLIIVRGRNYHPEDLEHTVNHAHTNFAPGACAAFAVDDAHGERLVVVQELLNDDRNLPAELVKEMFHEASVAVSQKHGIQLSELVLIERRSLHKTGSGKISRINNQKAWQEKSLQVVFNNQVEEFITDDLPVTETEKRLADIWMRLLDIEQVERSGDFMEYGGDSMAVVELSAEIRKAFNYPISPEMIYVHSVLSAMARAIDEQQVELMAINLDNELTLHLSAEEVAALPKPKAQHETILLTGATGFLGSYLLEALLREPNVKEVLVMVRSKDLAKGRKRLVKTLQEHHISLEHLDKATVLYGDLSRPRLGLSSTEFEALAAQADTIYHCGAQVDWVKPYTHLRAANVDGTRELIRLAATSTLKPLHYISTMWVLNSGINQTVGKIYDENHRAGWRGLENGYAQSKWVGENLVLKAAELGVPTTSHRMDFIVGSASSGVIPERDFLVRMVQDCLKMKVAMQENILIDVIEVDYLANAIVQLGKRPQENGKVFHYRGAESMSTDLMVDLMQERGHAIEKMPYLPWVQTVTADASNKSVPLQYFLEAYSMSPTITDPDHYDNNILSYERTLADLKQIGITPEQQHSDITTVFRNMLDYLGGVEAKKATQKKQQKATQA